MRTVFSVSLPTSLQFPITSKISPIYSPQSQETKTGSCRPEASEQMPWKPSQLGWGRLGRGLGSLMGCEASISGDIPETMYQEEVDLCPLESMSKCGHSLVALCGLPWGEGCLLKRARRVLN